MTARDIMVKAADGGEFASYLATPTQSSGSVIVVLQEIFGVNANIRAVADDLAAAGHVAIAPDLFWRQEPGLQLNPDSESDRAKAMALMKGMDEQRALDDAEAALAAAEAATGAKAWRGAVGYCLGGKFAYLLAARNGVARAVSYYGVAIQSVLDRAGEIKGRLLLHIAEEDALCPPDAQNAIKGAVSPLGERVVVKSYPKVGHAFARRNSPALNPTVAADANAATLAFLK